jgi:dTDP-3-amino-2,3,6-trideoxy-4-keto-D-glucose/dTDP-3-amino-3,4,6-trideoxy-alpha-D-glucose/dTDP-2,6-dideoxy-D-kanosamine transaminase
MTSIKSFDYLKSLDEIEPDVLAAVRRVLRSGHLILGPETAAFEEEFAAWAGARHAVAATSGTTALYLALAALDVGPGDEVVTVANTCSPTVAAIRLTGAVPVFVDVRDDDLMMDVGRLEDRITPRTRCILPVHLWGQTPDLDTLLGVARRHDLPVVEDCAQAHGTTWDGRKVGTFGAMGCFSFYPTKNIGAYGDAGAVVTDDADLAARLRRLRMYGYEGSPVSLEEGINGRINEIQAAVLRVKLRVYPRWLERRLAVAATYDSFIDNPSVRLPVVHPRARSSYHQYVVRSTHRDRLAAFLEERGIQSAIHYPTPVHHMPAYRGLCPDLRLPATEAACGEVLSLPVHEALEPDEARRVAEAVNRFDPRALRP